MKLLSRGVQIGSLAVAGVVLAVYLHRAAMPLPLYAWDEHGFAIRALFAPDAIARNAFVPAHSNGAFLGLIRAVDALPGAYLPALRAVNIAAYFAGLLAVAMVAGRTASPSQRPAWIFVAAAFPYYRFVASGLPEGVYVGVLAGLGVASALLYRRRPLSHGLIAGAAAAVLVLIKPHGLAVVAGLLAMAALDALTQNHWRNAPLRLVSFAAAFFGVGNAIQGATGQRVLSPAKFFVEDFYGATLTTGLAPGAVALGAVSLLAMGSAVVLLAGIPLLAGGGDIARRWRRAPKTFQFVGEDLLFLLLALALAATLCMAAIFAAKVAGDPSETRRLWGRYFEFFVPLLWLAASPHLERAETLADRRGRVLRAVIPLVGLAGLMLSFRAGVVLFPWDATALTAFFKADPARAAFGEIVPYRILAVTATLAAALAIGLGLRVSRVWLPYLVVLGVLSTTFDSAAMAPMIRQHNELAADFRAALPILHAQTGPTLALVNDANDADLTFAGLAGRPEVLIWSPNAVGREKLAAARTLITVRVDGVPLSGARRVFQGNQLSIFVRQPGLGPGIAR